MPIEILDANNNASIEPLDSAVTEPEQGNSQSILTLELMGQEGTATFKNPTIGEWIQFKKSNPNLSPGNLYRKLARQNVIDWAGNPEMPAKANIDIDDSTGILYLFTAVTSDIPFEVLADRSYKVCLSAGVIVFRRPNEEDLEKLEQLAKTSKDPVEIDISLACDLCTSWWRSDRSIMPADFYNLYLSDYNDIEATIKAFFRRTPKNNARGVS